MKKIIVILLAVVLAAGALYAGSKAPADEPMADKPMKKMEHKGHGEMHGHMDHMKVMNNVVAMDKMGKRTALCGCGKEFEVAADSPSKVMGDMTFYACGPMCADMMDKMPDEKKHSAMMKWHENYMSHDFASNKMMKGGKKMATCGCGMEFEVTADTHVIMDNGMKIYTCGEGCQTKMSGMDAEMRMKKEMGMMNGM